MNEEILEQSQEQESTTVGAKEQEEVVEEEVEETEGEGNATFTQEQVNDLVRARLDRFEKRLYKKYGVEDKKALEDLVGKGQSYDVVKERYESQKLENNSLKEKIAFLENNINPNRYEDVRAYFKGKEIEFNNDNLVNELSTHPEWLNQAEKKEPMTTIKVLGNDQSQVPTTRTTEKEQVAKLFGLKKLI